MKYGEIVILGVVFAPVYLMLLGWFLGRPRELRLPLIGVGYLVGTTVAMWAGMALFAAALGVVFY
jgi:hypothetical protein